MALDRYNLRILSKLQTDGRITNQELADHIGLSPSACLERVRKLEVAGFIEGYQAKLGLAELASHIMVIATITLHDHRPEPFALFESTIQKMKEVTSCQKVSGNFDYIATFICSDMARYHELSNQILATGSGVIELNSHVVMDCIKQFEGYPFETL